MRSAVAATALIALACAVGLTTPVPAAGSAAVRTGVVQASPGRRLSYREVGRGPVVLLVHGALLDGSGWDRTAAALASSARVIAVSRVGHFPDSTSLDSVRYTFEQHAADLVDFIRARRLGPVHLVGHSYGGVVAALVAARAPSEVRTLTLVELSANSLVADSAARVELIGRRRDLFARIAAAGSLEQRMRLLVNGVAGDGTFDHSAASNWRSCSGTLAPRPGSRSRSPRSTVAHSRATRVVVCSYWASGLPPISVRLRTATRAAFREPAARRSREPATTSCGTGPTSWPPSLRRS